MDESIARLLTPVAAVAALVLIYILIKLCGLWWRARGAGAPVPVARIVQMVLRRINPRPVIDAYAIAVTAGVSATLDDVESHAMMGGRVNRTMVACAAATKAGIDMPFVMARGMDLTGRDVMEAVQDLIRAKRDGDRKAAESVDVDSARAMAGKVAEVTVAVAPPGMVMLDGQRVNAVCSTGFIKKGAKVRIASAKDNMVIVEPIVGTDERTDT